MSQTYPPYPPKRDQCLTSISSYRNVVNFHSNTCNLLHFTGQRHFSRNCKSRLKSETLNRPLQLVNIFHIFFLLANYLTIHMLKKRDHVNSPFFTCHFLFLITSCQNIIINYISFTLTTRRIFQKTREIQVDLTSTVWSLVR